MRMWWGKDACVKWRVRVAAVCLPSWVLPALHSSLLFPVRCWLHAPWALLSGCCRHSSPWPTSQFFPSHILDHLLVACFIQPPCCVALPHCVLLLLLAGIEMPPHGVISSHFRVQDLALGIYMPPPFDRILKGISCSQVRKIMEDVKA